MLNEEVTFLEAVEAGLVLVAGLELLNSHLLDGSCGLRKISRCQSRRDEALDRI